jgi:VWFA-related protein
MTRAPVGLLLAAALVAVPAARQKERAPDTLDLIQVDVAVVDGKGRAIHGLQQTDFSVKDAGKPVVIETFTEVSGPDPRDPDSARTVVLLLDDTGVTATGTQAIQAIARAFVSSTAPFDEMPIVRLHARDDEPFGDRIAGEERIRDYRGGAWPFASWSTTREVLERIAQISRLIAPNTATRKVIVCIGSPTICNIQEPPYAAPRLFERAWLSALAEAARANVAVYALVPGAVSSRLGGVPEFTGGDVFASSYDMGPPIDRILQDASNYYVLGYWSAVSSDGLRKVEVKVGKKGARVLARKLR